MLSGLDGCSRTSNVLKNKKKFAKDICRKIAWAIHDAIVEFFSVHCSPSECSQGADVEWPTCDLTEIVQAVRHARPLVTGSFPDKWDPNYYIPNTRRGRDQGGSGGGGGRGNRNTRQQQQQQQQQQRQLQQQNNRRNQQQPLTLDKKLAHCYAQVRQDLQVFHEKFKGRIHLREICDVAGVRVNQLQVILQYICGGRNDLCYAHLLGHCQHSHGCNFIHVHKNDVQPPFIDSVLTMIKRELSG